MAVAPGPGGGTGCAAAGSPTRPAGSGAAGGGQLGRPCRVGPHPASPSLQYFADAAEAASWLREQQCAMESASCGQDQAAAEALLRRHLRLGRAVRAFGAELHSLDEQARAAAAQAALTVCAGPGRDPERRDYFLKPLGQFIEPPVFKKHVGGGQVAQPHQSVPFSFKKLCM